MLRIELLVAATGARFTAMGIVTPGPARVESVLTWANRLQERAQYLIVQNATSPEADFGHWESAEQAIRFREALSLIVIQMEFRLAELAKGFMPGYSLSDVNLETPIL